MNQMTYGSYSRDRGQYGNMYDSKDMSRQKLTAAVTLITDMITKIDVPMERFGDDGYCQVPELSQWTPATAAQEMKAENDALKAKNSEFEARISALELK
ncbi:MAG: hypothetical protein HYY37_03460 [Candidatus Aenigmarchaeota archaeon]|nr:hypothetical protein [Candidatus Aenigmarchaeota archaeon]